jgi:ABC-type Fe3+ transport system permease subunit
MIITVLSVLGSVAVGALIVWAVTRGNRPQRSLGAPMAPPLDLGPQVAQIRALIRAANHGDLASADQAAALLDHLESTYGFDAVSRSCNPNKLRGLIQKVQDRHALPPAA